MRSVSTAFQSVSWPGAAQHICLFCLHLSSRQRFPVSSNSTHSVSLHKRYISSSRQAATPAAGVSLQQKNNEPDFHTPDRPEARNRDLKRPDWLGAQSKDRFQKQRRGELRPRQGDPWRDSSRPAPHQRDSPQTAPHQRDAWRDSTRAPPGDRMRDRRRRESDNEPVENPEIPQRRRLVQPTRLETASSPRASKERQRIVGYLNNRENKNQFYDERFSGHYHNRPNRNNSVGFQQKDKSSNTQRPWREGFARSAPSERDSLRGRDGQLSSPPTGQVESEEQDVSFEDNTHVEDRVTEKARRGGKAERGRGGKASRREQKFIAEDALETEEERKAREANERKRKAKRAAARAAPVPIELPQFVTVANLATLLKVRQGSFIEKLKELGFSADETKPDHVLNFENAGLIAMEFNYEAMADRGELDDIKARPQPEDRSTLPARPPVVTIMGHVDHGKTTLLDYLRKSSVAASEHGGITQHIGAFSVPMTCGRIVTFLDTPGHAAFLSMRQRGANVTDIVVLVVAADDSVKPQTVEAIKHARAANVPMIVAINKVDKDGADIERVKQDLTRHEIVVEDYGGDIQAIPVSGKTGQGIQDLEEALVAQAETVELRTEVDGQAEGWIIEAGTESRGRVATVLVKRGTMRPGDVIVAGNAWARIRTLMNEAGLQVSEAGPGTPVEVDGWREQPTAGDEVLQAPTEQEAVSAVEYRLEKLERIKANEDIDAINAARRLEEERRERERLAATDEEAPTSKSKKTTEEKELYFIIKADVSGSIEAVEGSVMSLPLSNQPVKVSILRTGVGAVTESDIAHAGAVPAGQGFIVSFNQTTSPSMMQLAERSNVKILEENIIYNIVDVVRGLVEQHLPPIVTQRVLGEAEAAQIFEINIGGRKTTKIVGCKIRNGTISKGKKVRVLRGGETVHTGTISSLRSHKKDVTEMGKGSECGIAFEDWAAFEVGDSIQCFEEHHEKRRLT